MYYKDNKEIIKRELYLSLLKCSTIKLSSESKYSSHKLFTCSMGFDIETYHGFMYVCQFAYYVNGYHDKPVTVLFRKWSEFSEFIYEVIAPVSMKGGKSVYVRNKGRQYKVPRGEFVIGIHNMGYEFQWLRSIFSWSRVFSSDKRKPYYAILDDIDGHMSGIKFIDTLKLFPTKLEKVAEIVNSPVEKLVGDLNHNTPHNSLTKLSEIEEGYCRNDVIILCYALNYVFETFAIPFQKFPVSQTSQIRHKILESSKDRKYTRLLDYISDCVIDLDLYKYLRGQVTEYNGKKYRLGFFEGGYTHANLLHSTKAVSDVYHFDYTSSYPYVMLSDFYPYKIDEMYLGEDIESYFFNQDNDWIMELELSDVENTRPYGVISSSKCIHINAVLDNGKVLKADKVITIRTRREWETYKKFYTCTVRVRRAFHCDMRPLPRFVTDNIREQFKIKAELKKVIKKLEKEKKPIPPDINSKYNTSKQFVNGIYGMFVTEVHTENYVINDGHNLELEQISLDKIEKSMKKNPLLAQWGMFVTMYARTRLLEDIWRLGNHFIYSDTDSAFFTYDEEFMKYIESENKRIESENMENYSEELLSDIGCYTMEEHCKTFKTCGAKCYVQIFDDDTFEPTISGISKKIFIDYCLNNNFSPLDLVEDCVITDDLTQKLRPVFYDYPRFETITDEQGNSENMFELTSQELIPSGWTNSLNRDYEQLLENIQTNMKSVI